MDIDKVFNLIDSGEVKLYELEDYLGIDSNEATKLRSDYLEHKFKKDFKYLTKSIIDFDAAVNSNIENSIGAVQVPLGYIGIINVNGSYLKGDIPAVIATTEGKLTAGLSRGLNIINSSGGVESKVISDGMTRDVLVSCGSLNESYEVFKFVSSDDGFNFLKSKFSEKTIHGKLISVKPYIIGKNLHIRFKAFTGSAMGMNMVTIASKHAVDSLADYLYENNKIRMSIISESGNMCSDKKPSYIDFLEGRGVSVTCSAFIKKDILTKYRTDQYKVEKVNMLKNLEGSAMAGSSGFNSQVANVLAGMYLAYGQDLAQIVEGSQAVVDAEADEEGLYISILMPSIEVGTYGGGTKLPTQREVLSLSGLYGEGDSDGLSRLRLAELISSIALAGELNLLIIESANELSFSHSQLKRG